MTFSIKGDNFYQNDKKVFLNSGEIHYFRIKRELWDTHLQAAKDAGLTTISTYVPWAWHEAEEGVFDFEGKSVPECDLKGWLKRCQDLGFTCIVKPGPFILAEFRGAGLPDWFMNKYSSIVKMRNRKGEIFPSDGVSLFNQIYLDKVTLWYNHVMPFISKHEISAGGPIIMMQICNEIGVFSWLARQADYNPPVKDHFRSFLLGKYSDIDELNGVWDTTYKTFEDVELPPDGKLPYQSRADRGRDYQWHCFWRTYYGDYLRMLSEMARKRGVTVPLYHNLPGWIYGNGYEFPVNITMYEDLFHKKSDIIFGIDHIPEFLSYRNLHDDRIINDITYAMQGNKPLFAAEFQSGSREYHVVTNPREMELFYKASIANGLTGWNYYMFSQGRNPRHKGYSGETFYWFNPLTAEGKRTSAFPLVKRMNQIVSCTESIIVEAKRKAEICVLFYPPYYASELERPMGGNCELTFTPSAIRRPAYFDGLLKALLVLNIDYDMLDLKTASPEDLGKYKQVWAFATDEMNAENQQTIVDYTRSGGNLVLFPYLPDREMSNKPCTIIRDALEIKPSGKEIIDSPLVDVYDCKDVKCANPFITFSSESLAEAEIIARNLNGNICGFSKVLGRGKLIFLGTWIGFDTEGQKAVYESILQQSSAHLRQTSSDNENITVRERFTPGNSAILFAANYYNEEHSAKLFYTHPVNNEKISIPYSKEEMLWPPLYGILTPVNFELKKGLKILHCTSDILNISERDGRIELTLFGDRDLLGEIVFEGTNVNTIKSAKIASVDVKMETDGSRIILNYTHKHKEEFVLLLE